MSKEEWKPQGSSLTDQQLKEWASKQPEFQALTTPEERRHILTTLRDLQRWYYEDLPIGHFLTALISNDLMETIGRADGTNTKVLPLYAKFLYNHMPMDYKQKAKRDFQTP